MLRSQSAQENTGLVVSSRTLRVNDDLPVVHDDKRTLAWFYSDKRELLFGIERVRVRVFLYFKYLKHLPLTAFTFCF